MKASRGEILAAIGAWSAALLSALFNLLNHNDYPFLSPEVAMVSGVLLLIAATVGLVHKIAPRVSFAFTGSMVAVGFSLNGASELIVIAILLGALVLAWFFDRAVIKLATAAFATVALFQFGEGVLKQPEPEPTDIAKAGPANLPPIVHVVFDAYLGTEGMAADPALAPLREETVSFYTGHGFRLYDGAYSRHSNTANSIPHALSFGAAPLTTSSPNVQHFAPPRLEYFELLKRRGYSIGSLHVDFIDYCGTQPIDNCATFRRSDLSAAAYFDLSTADRAKLIGLTLADMSRLPTAGYRSWSWAQRALTGKAPPSLHNQTKLYPAASVKAIERFIRSLSRAQNGHVYYAHFLVPHDPYMFDRNCRIQPRADWQGEGGPGSIAERQARYADQARCTLRLVDRMLIALDRTAAGKRAIVVIHGDHGSRIVEHAPMAENPDVSPRDYAMTYSALFAVRAPGIEPGMVTGRVPLERLIEGLAKSNYRNAPQPDSRPAQVYLSDGLWVPKRRIDLPAYGAVLTDN